MKKAIAILAIMVVLVGVVFAADEAHTIKLKTKITGDDPVFSLSAAYVASENSTITASTNTQDIAFSNTTYEGDRTIDVADLSKNSVTVNFAAQLANDAKTVKVYNLEFVPGPFAAKIYNEQGNEEPYSIYPNSNTTTGALIENFETNRKGVTATAVTSTLTDGQISFTTDLTFNGKVCTSGDLATFKVVYDQVTDKDLVKGDYTANVQMTISTT